MVYYVTLSHYSFHADFFLYVSLTIIVFVFGFFCFSIDFSFILSGRLQGWMMNIKRQEMDAIGMQDMKATKNQ